MVALLDSEIVPDADALSELPEVSTVAQAQRRGTSHTASPQQPRREAHAPARQAQRRVADEAERSEGRSVPSRGGVSSLPASRRDRAREPHYAGRFDESHASTAVSTSTLRSATSRSHSHMRDARRGGAGGGGGGHAALQRDHVPAPRRASSAAAADASHYTSERSVSTHVRRERAPPPQPDAVVDAQAGDEPPRDVGASVRDFFVRNRLVILGVVAALLVAGVGVAYFVRAQKQAAEARKREEEANQYDAEEAMLRRQFAERDDEVAELTERIEQHEHSEAQWRQKLSEYEQHALAQRQYIEQQQMHMQQLAAEHEQAMQALHAYEQRMNELAAAVAASQNVHDASDAHGPPTDDQYTGDDATAEAMAPEGPASEHDADTQVAAGGHDGAAETEALSDDVQTAHTSPATTAPASSLTAGDE